MRRKTFFSLICAVVCTMAFGQVVTSEPSFPTGDESIKIIIDLKQSQDSRANGLLGQTDGIYLWSGAGRSASDPWEFGPPGQTNFNQAFEPGRMTAEGNDVWSITLTPRSYFNVPEEVPILILGMVIKNTDGSAQTEDLFLELSDGSFEVRFEQPVAERIVAFVDEVVSINAVSSEAAELTLTIEGQEAPLKEESNAVMLSYDLTVTETGTKTVTITANNGSTEQTDTFELFVPNDNVVEALPDGTSLGINYISGTQATLALQAPGKRFVHVIGEFNDWTLMEEYQMKVTPDGSTFWLTLEGLTEGQEYIFQYLVEGDLRVGDPYADKVSIPGTFGDQEIINQGRYQGLKPYPGGARFEATYLQTGQEAYQWQHPDYEKPQPGELVIYEVLVRDFDDRRSYDAVRERLEYIKSIGVNAIELMPIMEYDGNLSWGYNPSFFFAPDKYYGTKQALKQLIDEAHGMGMVVILDMVLNHAWGPNPLVRLFNEGDYGRPTSDNPWLNTEAKHPFNVGYDFNHESELTQAFVDSVNHYWLNEYKFDGLRFDLSKGFTQKFTGNNVDAWNAYDAGRVALLKRMYDKIKSYSPDAYVILEHLGGSTEERELANHGMMLWGNFNYDFRDMAKGESKDFSWMSYQERNWNGPNVVAYMESHDEERLMWEALNFGNTLDGKSMRELPNAVDRIQMLTTFFLGIPGAKMFWQFGEFGYDEELNDDRLAIKPTRWEYLQNAERQRLLKLYQALLGLRNELSAFHSDNIDMDLSGNVKRILLRDSQRPVYIIGNFGTLPTMTSFQFPSVGKWYDFFTGNEVNVTNVNEQFELAVNQFHVFTTEPVTKPESGIVNFSIGNIVTSLEDHRAKVEIGVYPSPTKGDIVLDLGDRFLPGFELRIVDALGQPVKYSPLEVLSGNRFSTTLESGASGLLIISVEGQDEVARKKLIKH